MTGINKRSNHPVKHLQRKDKHFKRGSDAIKAKQILIREPLDKEAKKPWNFRPRNMT